MVKNLKLITALDESKIFVKEADKRITALIAKKLTSQNETTRSSIQGGEYDTSTELL